MYMIGINSDRESIVAVHGNNATISRSGDEVTVKFANSKYIYSNAILIAPKELV